MDCWVSGLISSAWWSLTDSPHIFATEWKDVRWVAFFDHALRWDTRWHAEALVHQYAFWLEGRNPWTLCPTGDQEASDQRSTLYGLQLCLWCIHQDNLIIKLENHTSRKGGFENLNKQFGSAYPESGANTAPINHLIMISLARHSHHSIPYELVQSIWLFPKIGVPENG